MDNVLDMGNGKLEEKTYECKEIEWVVDNFFPTIDQKVCATWNSDTLPFNDEVWKLSVNFAVLDNRIFAQLILRRESKIQRGVKYYVGLKNRQNKEVHLHTGILPDGKESCYVPNFHYKSLLQRKSIFTHSGSLIVICTLKLKPEHSSQAQLNLINLDELSDNFKNLFGNKETCDTTLKVKDKDFSAHRSVLIARSSVFAATFKHDSLENQTGVIDIPDCDPDSFQQFLEYLYCGKLDGISLTSALNLYYTSDKYDVQELKAFCVEYLIQSLTTETVCEIAVLADTYEELQLNAAVEEFFNENTFEILLTSEWDNFLTKHHRLANKFLKQMSKLRVKK